MKNNYFIASLKYTENEQLNYQTVKNYLENILFQIEKKQFYDENINYEYLIAIDIQYEKDETIQFYLKKIKKIIFKNYDTKYKLINKYILKTKFHTTK